MTSKTKHAGDKNIYLGIPDLSDTRIRQIAKLNIFAAILICPHAIGWSIFWMREGLLGMSAICFAYLPCAYWIYRETKTGNYYRGFNVFIAGLVFWISFIVITVSGPGVKFGENGEYVGSVHAFFLVLAVAVYLVFEKSPNTIRYGLTLLMILLFVCVHMPVVSFTPLITMHPTHHFIAGIVSWSSATLTSFGIWLWLYKTSLHYERKIEFTNEKLHTLFSDALLKGQTRKVEVDENVVARAIPDCSVMYVEVTNLAKLCKTVKESDLLEMLNALHGEFDTIVYDLSLEKVQTYEFTYMIASGVAQKKPSHANELASIGLRFIEIANKFQALQIFIGIHSGAVTAGTAKEKEFFFALWGETVEEVLSIGKIGIPGQVCITEGTYQKIKASFRCEQCRNLGDNALTKIYQVLSRRDSLTLS